MNRLAIKKNIIRLGNISQLISLIFLLIFGQTAGYAQTVQGGIVPNGKTTFLDNNGKPLSSGQVFFYTQGTTTPKTTYQDINQTIPNTNPVVLDAAGRALIWGYGTYRQIVKDKNNNLIWDVVTAPSGLGSSGSTATGDGDAVGTVKPWAGITPPNQYMFTYGQTLNRAAYAPLFQAITSNQAVFCTSGSPTLTGLSDTTSFWIGMTVELTCAPAGYTTITAKTSNSVTLAVNANISTNTSATFFPWGNGDHLSTFNLPDYRGLIPMGNNIMGGTAGTYTSDAYFGAKSANSSGAVGGQFAGGAATLNTSNLPAYTPTGSIANGAITSTFNPGPGQVLLGGSGAGNFNSGSFATGGVTGTVTSTQANSSFIGLAQGGTSTPFSVIPPTMTTNFIIKVTPDTAFSGTGVTTLGGMSGDIICGTNLNCSGNVISSNSAAGIVLNSTQILGGASSGSILTVTNTGCSSLTPCLSQGNSSLILPNGASAVTQTNGDNSTRIATDAFVLANGGGSGTTLPTYQIFTNPGSVTTLTLTSSPVPTSTGMVSITFDGVTQARNTWSLNLGTSVITFNSPIPNNVQQIEVDWWSPSTVGGVASIGGSSGAITLGGGLSISSNTLSVLPRMLWANDYGAVCDGSTDDHVAFQNMINAAQTLGASANFKGLCALTTGLTINGAKGLIFQGIGFGQSQLIVPPTITAIAVSNTGGVYLRNFYVTEPTQTPCGGTSETNIPAISVTTMTGTFVVEDVEINCASPGITIAGTSDFHIHKVKIGNVPTAAPVAMSIANSGATPSDDGDISSSLFGGYVFCTECAGLRVENNKWNAVGLPYGFLMTIPNGYADGDLFFVGNSMEGITGNDIVLSRAGTTGAFGTVVISGNELSGAIGVFIPTDATAAWITGLVITGNLMAVSAAGTSIDSVYNLTVANNTVQCANSGVVPNAIGPHVIRGLIGPNLAGTSTGAICAASVNSGVNVTTYAPF